MEGKKMNRTFYSLDDVNEKASKSNVTPCKYYSICLKSFLSKKITNRNTVSEAFINGIITFIKGQEIKTKSLIFHG